MKKTKQIERLLSVEIAALQKEDLVLAALAKKERLAILDTVLVN